MEKPRVQFATTSDGVIIAYASVGSGPPLVVMPGWVSHLELIWQAALGEFIERFAKSHQVITYDGRGTGLSDRNITDVSVEARLRDLEAVVEQTGLERFSLFAWSQATPVAMVYAAEHPERVEKLALFAAFCGGHKGEAQENNVLKALLDLMRAEWGIGARTTMGFVHPDADREEMELELAFLRASSSGEIAARILEEGFTHTDVRDYLPRIKAPSLIMHRRDDHAISSESGRIVASLIPNARFLLLDGDHHTPSTATRTRSSTRSKTSSASSAASRRASRRWCRTPAKRRSRSSSPTWRAPRSLRSASAMRGRRSSSARTTTSSGTR